MNPFQKMYDISINLLTGIDKLWIFLNTEIHIGFDIPLLGHIGIAPFTPLGVIGASFVLIFVLWLVKGLLPVA